MRINGFEQIKVFYSWVFNNADKSVKPHHISLYLFLVNQNNRNNWVEWFKCPFDLGMAGSCIGNKKTYYKTLDDLQEWGLLKYEKGINNWKAPLIKLEVLIRTTSVTATDTASVPTSEPQVLPLDTPLPTPLGTHIYKPITNNLKPITNNNDADEEIDYRAVHLEFADRLLLNDLECQAIFEVSEKRVTFELLNTFVAHLTNQSKVYNHYSEFKKHFSNWMRKHEPSKENKSKVDAYLENNLAAKKILGI